VKEIDPKIIEWLDQEGKLYAQEDYTHAYPFCWRCHTALLYYARSSWFIAMTKVKKQLLKNNEQISWTPAHLKEGRFGEWLGNAVDWAVSRDRYWGTPIPIWKCDNADCAEEVCIGSFAELAEYTGKKDIRAENEKFDPHRPFIDELMWTCEKGNGTMRRTAGVMDTWFDSGSMPFAQWHYPFEHKEKIDKGEQFPADFISEAIDQTRGWFYTLLAVSTAMGYDVPPYRNVISLGHVNDQKGKKMSKHLGNVVDPWEVIEGSSADAVRWYFYTVNDPGESKNLDPEAIQTVVKRTFRILENVAAFYGLYKDGERDHDAPAHALDRWLHARTSALVRAVTRELDAYAVTRAVRHVDEFIQDLSTWYVRRSRDRFKQGDAQALATLEYALATLARLMAPFAPFFAEYVYETTGGDKASVHLERWPQAGAADEKVLAGMAYVRKAVVLGHAAREQAKIKVRQPLSQVVVHGVSLSEEERQILAEELNVVEAHTGDMPKEKGWIAQESGGLAVGLDTTITDELKEQGWVRELVRSVNAERKKQGFTPRDRIVLSYKKDPQAERFMEVYGEAVRAGTGASESVAAAHVEGTTLPLGDFSIAFTLKKA
jgi:isoleucyl-tRNA synthetase